jgi:hypothetical protein
VHVKGGYKFSAAHGNRNGAESQGVKSEASAFTGPGYAERIPNASEHSVLLNPASEKHSVEAAEATLHIMSFMPETSSESTELVKDNFLGLPK